MNYKADKVLLLLHLKKWGLSYVLLFPVWWITDWAFMSVGANVMIAVYYEFPSIFKPFFFVMDNLTLIIHEAGHTFFRIFPGRFLMFLGGSFLQILIPFLIAFTAWKKGQSRIFQLSLFWLGFSWLETSIYCADALGKQLPLIGNLSTEAHDFYNMLYMMNLLDHYQAIARALFSMGLVTILVCVVWPFLERRLKHH